MMAISKAQQKAVAKYETKAYDKTLIRLPKGRLDEIRAHIEPAGESLNGFIGRAISETMERDASQYPVEASGKAANPLKGIITPDTLRAAQKAAQATGETVTAFLSRAVEVQAQRDRITLRMGMSPATQEKITKE